MIDKDKFHMFNYIKKEEYTGSMEGMRYMLRKKKGKKSGWKPLFGRNPMDMGQLLNRRSRGWSLISARRGLKKQSIG